MAIGFVLFLFLFPLVLLHLFAKNMTSYPKNMYIHQFFKTHQKYALCITSTQ